MLTESTSYITNHFNCLCCREKQALLDDAEACKRKMNAASTLINGLAGERVRWTAQSKEFKSQIGQFIGHYSLILPVQ